MQPEAGVTGDPERRAASRSLPYLTHVPVVLFLFSGALLQGGVPYFRDLLSHYYPDYAFVARSAGQGIAWPLWNPLVHAGAPFLMPYPLDLVSVWLLGPLQALRIDAPLHVLLAMCGASLLAGWRGCGSIGVWATGLFYGLSGFLLSSSNSMQFFHAACWAPWLVAAALRAFRIPDARSGAWLGLAAALQLSTLAADVVVQTAFASLFLLPSRPSWRQLRAVAVVAMRGALLAALLAAPVLLGASWLLQDTRRSLGFEPAEVLAWSASPLVLLEAVVPRLFGDVRTFSELGFWGKPFFDDGYPYFMSLYLGPGIVLLALLAGRHRGASALWVLTLVGLSMSLGANGPFASVQPLLFSPFRFPIKFFFLSNLALCLLAGQGADECSRRAGLSLWRFALPAVYLAAAGALFLWPELPSRLLGRLVPELLGASAQHVARTAWPADLFRAGALCLAAAFALRLPARRGVLAAALVATDMLAANLVLNPTARRDFYELVPPLRAQVERAVASGPFRWFALSLNAVRGVRFSAWVAALNSDVIAYRVARQSMLGTSAALDGLESAFEEEDSFAPLASTLPRELRTAQRFREFVPHLRLANVRWVLSLAELPPDLVRLVSQVALPELEQPLRFYELLGPVERAFWTPRCEVVPERSEIWRRVLVQGLDARRAVLLETAPGKGACDGHASGAASVAFEQPDAHTVRLRVGSPPGFVVVLQGFHPDWTVEGAAGGVRLLRAYGRYWALWTPGGEQRFVVRFRPRWPILAAILAALGMLAAGLSFACPVRSATSARAA